VDRGACHHAGSEEDRFETHVGCSSLEEKPVGKASLSRMETMREALFEVLELSAVRSPGFMCL
jgi:hypothetical protein